MKQKPVKRLPPKRLCNQCGKPVGRKWKDFNICNDCYLEMRIERGLDSRNLSNSGDIPL